VGHAVSFNNFRWLAIRSETVNRDAASGGEVS
jgi:hypothetical protein